MRLQGKITRWKEDQGYGFVEQNGTGQQAFVHISAFAVRGRRPVEGDLITYEVTRDKQNRLRAAQIRFVEAADTQVAHTLHNTLAVAAGGGFLVALAVLFFTGHVPFWLVVGDVLLSLLTFIVYGVDKSAALRQMYRVPENTLHLLALLGGWPGASLAQRLFRHKTRKTAFLVMFYLCLFVNTGVTGWYFLYR